jgi:hypothetical protein
MLWRGKNAMAMDNGAFSKRQALHTAIFFKIETVEIRP